jgi:hypothetical protein
MFEIETYVCFSRHFGPRATLGPAGKQSIKCGYCGARAVQLAKVPGLLESGLKVSLTGTKNSPAQQAEDLRALVEA